MEPPKVSRREAEVLAAAGGHLSNAEIAAELGISVRTVESHVSALLRKFGVADRRMLVRAAAAQAQVGDGDGGRLPGLPVAATSFVGRSHEVDAAVPAVRAPGLVTLVGPGGVGKTRLACVVAERAAAAFDHAGGFIDLVPVAPEFAVATVAAALGVPEVPQRSMEQSIAAFLADRHALLVLDNCEHVLAEVAPLVDRILATCPRVTVLVTSRERLGIGGERVLQVGPLPLASDAEALFAARVGGAAAGSSGDAASSKVVAGPATVAAICARLDGLPLAIELAAARIASLGADGLLAALDDLLRAVSGGRSSDRRHTSLSAVLGWSYELLTETERRVFAEMSVFCGGFDLAAAVAVDGGSSAAEVADVLGRLAEKCLILRDGARWRMLRTVRAFADGQLRAGAEFRGQVVRRHLGWAADLAEALLDRVAERASERASKRVSEPASEEAPWIAEFDLVADDLRAALAAAEPGAEGERLAWALARLAYARRLLRESVAHFRRAAELALDDQRAAAALRTAGHATFAIGRAEEAHALLRASAERGSGRDSTIALCEAVLTAARFPSGFSDAVDSVPLIDGKAADAEVAAYMDAARLWTAEPGPPQRAPAALAARAEASARAAGDSILLSAVLARSGRTAERLLLLPTMDHEDPRFAAELLEIWHSDWLDALAGGRPRAAALVAEQIRDHDLLGRHPYRPAGKLIPPLVLLGRFDEAVALAEPMWRAWRDSSAPAAALISPAASCMALVYGLRGELGAQRMWGRRARQALGGGGSGPNPGSDPGPGSAELVAYHEPFAAFTALRLAVHHGVPFPYKLSGGAGDAYITAAAAELAVVTAAPDAAERLRRAERAADPHPWAAACLARARGRLDGDPKALAEAVDLWDEVGARFERAVTLVLTDDRDEGRAELKALGVPVDRPDSAAHHGA